MQRLDQPSTTTSRFSRCPSCSRQFRCPRLAALSRPLCSCAAAPLLPSAAAAARSEEAACPAAAVEEESAAASFLSACSYSVSAADQQPAFSAAST